MFPPSHALGGFAKILYIRGLEKKNSDVVIKTIRINDEKGDPD